MAGDFLKFYDSYFDDIYRYVRSRLGNSWDTDDVVSEVFLKAYQHYGEARGPEKAWLVTIARNSITDFYRRSGREVPTDVEPQGTQADEGELLEAQEEQECLHKALGTLPPEQMEIVRLRYFTDMKFRDLAVALDVRPATAKMRLYRILDNVREKVEACLGN
jgi:RNA polymerase sigma-70 factor (ECF subfamily)